MTEYDAADVTWTDAGLIEIKWVTVYKDRPLTRWERIKVRWLRRPDPRVLHSGRVEAQ